MYFAVSGIRRVVAGGIGVVLVPASLRNLPRAGVVYKTIRGLSPTVEMGAIWRRDDRNPVVRLFVSVVDEICRQRRGRFDQPSADTH
jgi:DNA-binding transcriptional LysR family regulator